jgi:hypothetical protein
MPSQYLGSHQALQSLVEPVVCPSTKLKGSSAICTKEALPSVEGILYRAGGCLDAVKCHMSTKALYLPPPTHLCDRVFR